MMLQELVVELKKHMVFKGTTAPGDLVLIAADNPRMLVYARVESIEPDAGRKGTWWHVTMQLLTVPPQLIVWTLREQQFTGREIFTMGGDQRFMQAVLLEGKPADLDFGTDETESKDNSRPFRRVK